MTDDIFNPEWTSGNLTAIDFIADSIGTVAMIVISIVGFSIVMASILKNTMNGLYAVFPKFFDKVDEVKQAQLTTWKNTRSSGTTAQSKMLGTIMVVFLSLIPNVKAMTDFEDGMQDAKSYFMKAIPLMCVQIFLGVFIFFGYPAQVAEKFSEFGTSAFDMVLTNVDPVAWVEAVPDNLAVLKFATDGSLDPVDQAANTIAKKATNTLVGTVSEMTKEKRLDVAVQVENWVITNMGDCTEYCNTDKYDMDVTATVYKTGGEPDISRVHMASANGVSTFAYVKQVSEFVGDDVPTDVSGWWLRYDLKFTQKATKATSSNSAVTMSVSNSSFIVNTSAKPNTITIKVSDASTTGYGLVINGSRSQGSAVVGGSTVDVEIKLVGNTITATAKTSGKSLEGATEITGIQGLYYTYSNSKNAIKAISTGGSGVTFTTGDGRSWGFGEDPVATLEGDTSSGSSQSSGDSIN